jgi:hypothetical protein
MNIVEIDDDDVSVTVRDRVTWEMLKAYCEPIDGALAQIPDDARLSNAFVLTVTREDGTRFDVVCSTAARVAALIEPSSRSASTICAQIPRASTPCSSRYAALLANGCTEECRCGLQACGNLSNGFLINLLFSWIAAGLACEMRWLCTGQGEVSGLRNEIALIRETPNEFSTDKTSKAARHSGIARRSTGGQCKLHRRTWCPSGNGGKFWQRSSL